MIVVGDGQLLRIVLENLLGNAWKFTAREPGPRIEFGQTQVAGEPTYFVRDNGAGFDMTYVDKLFTPFQRLHLASEFPGSGRGARHGAAHHPPARRPGVGGGPHGTGRHLPLHDRSAAGLSPASRERPPSRRPPVPLSEHRVGGAARSAGAPAPPPERGWSPDEVARELSSAPSSTRTARPAPDAYRKEPGIPPARDGPGPARSRAPGGWPTPRRHRRRRRRAWPSSRARARPSPPRSRPARDRGPAGSPEAGRWPGSRAPSPALRSRRRASASAD